MITDALNSYVEDMERLVMMNYLWTILGRIPFYKVDKGLCPDMRKWYIKYTRLATQLNRLNNKLSVMDKLHWRGTHQQLPRER